MYVLCGNTESVGHRKRDVAHGWPIVSPYRMNPTDECLMDDGENSAMVQGGSRIVPHTPHI